LRLLLTLQLLFQKGHFKKYLSNSNSQVKGRIYFATKGRRRRRRRRRKSFPSENFCLVRRGTIKIKNEFVNGYGRRGERPGSREI